MGKEEYIKIIEDRENILEAGEKHIVELINKNIDHKRAFLGTIMTISAAVIAGLFILFTGKNFNDCVVYLAAISGFGFVAFIISAGIYLTWILSQESSLLDRGLKFIKESKEDFIKNVNNGTINDLNSYEKYRGEQHKKEIELKQKIKGSSEFWFVLINILFIVSWIFLLLALLYIKK